MLNKLPSLQVIITAHKEGALILPTMQSAMNAIDDLRKHYEVDVDIMIYLDNPNQETLQYANDIAKTHSVNVYKGQNGDPGQSRIKAIELARNELIALLDGDDLWSENWLKKAYDQISFTKELTETVFHPEYNLIFGGSECLVRQGNPQDPFFDPQFLRIGNYWDALCIAHKDIFTSFPYQKNDLDKGYAHEDYLWGCETYLAGIKHVLIKDTVHFKRRRKGSVSVMAESKGVKPRVTKINRYEGGISS